MTNGEKLRELLAENFPELTKTKGVVLRPASEMNICNWLYCSDMPNCEMCRKHIGEDWQDKEYIDLEERKKKKFKTKGTKFIEAIKESFPEFKNKNIDVLENADMCTVLNCVGIDCSECPFDGIWTKEETDELIDSEESEETEKKQEKSGDELNW